MDKTMKIENKQGVAIARSFDAIQEAVHKTGGAFAHHYSDKGALVCWVRLAVNEHGFLQLDVGSITDNPAGDTVALHDRNRAEIASLDFVRVVFDMEGIG